MNLLLLTLLSGSFQEIDGKVLCPRSWIEAMLVKDDSLEYVTTQLIPWYETQIAVQDSIITEQGYVVQVQKEQILLLQDQVKIEKKVASSNLIKGSIGGFLLGTLTGVILTLWIVQ